MSKFLNFSVNVRNAFDNNESEYANFSQLLRDTRNGVFQSGINSADANEMIRAQTIALRMAERILEEKRVKMQKAMQERKTQDILKEHAFEEFLAEEKAAESKAIDELTSYTHGQKKTDLGE